MKLAGVAARNSSLRRFVKKNRSSFFANLLTIAGVASTSCGTGTQGTNNQTQVSSQAEAEARKKKQKLRQPIPADIF